MLATPISRRFLLGAVLSLGFMRGIALPVTAHEFKAAGEDPPEWSKVKALSDPWVPEHPFLEHDEIIEQTPDYLARLNIFVPARDLVTA